MNTTNVNDIIVYNTTKGYDYLSIPNEYYCIYTKLLQSLSNLGIDMIKDCKNSCKGNGTNIINCWNMFQTACAAYKLGEVKKADLIIKYINAQMKFNCPNIIRKYSKIIYFGDSNIPITESIILSGDSIDFYEKSEVSIPFFKKIHYIAIPEGIYLESAENQIIAGQWLFNDVTGDDDYIKNKIVLNGEIYYLWYIEYEEPLNAYVNVIFKEYNWEVDKIIYYKNVNTKPNITDILLGNTFDISTGDLFQTAITTKGHYFAIPEGYIVNTVENASFRGDWLYNISTNDNVYTQENILINNHKYILWYAEFPIPLNATIEIKFSV